MSNADIAADRKKYAARRAATVAAWEGVTVAGFDSLARSYAIEDADGEEVLSSHWATAALMLSQDIDMATVEALRRASRIAHELEQARVCEDVDRQVARARLARHGMALRTVRR